MKRNIESAPFAGPAADFGTTLHDLRGEAGWTIAQMAEEIHYSRAYLNNVELGKKSPTRALAEACDQALGTGERLQALLRAPQPAGNGRQRPLQLPPPVGPFIGRELELAELDRLLAGPPGSTISGVAAVSGQAGMGKTWLALHWARHRAERYPDGVLWVDLHGDSTRGGYASPAAILGTWLHTLGVPDQEIPADADARTALWRTLLADRHMLIVLDNAASAAQVRPLLPSGPGNRVLVTSRQRLIDLSTRDGAAQLRLRPFTAAEAIALFNEILGAEVVRAQPSAVHALVDRANREPHRLRRTAEHALAHPEQTLTEIAAHHDSPADRSAVDAAEHPVLRFNQQLEEADVNQPSVSRIYNYYLGGAGNFEPDREFARRAQQILPDIHELAISNRRFLVRALRYCLDQGIRQFIDIGAGIPSSDAAHEIAQAHDPSSTVVYVDNETITVEHIRDVIAGNRQAGVVHADLRDPDRVLHNAVTDTLIDFGTPVALIMGLLLHFVPDEDHPVELLAQYRRRLAPGSHLIISHDTADGRGQDMRRFAELYSSANRLVVLRNHTELTQLIQGFTLVPPGIVHVPLWQPDPAAPPVEQPERSCVYALVARVES